MPACGGAGPFCVLPFGHAQGSEALEGHSTPARRSSRDLLVAVTCPTTKRHSAPPRPFPRPVTLSERSESNGSRRGPLRFSFRIPRSALIPGLAVLPCFPFRFLPVPSWEPFGPGLARHSPDSSGRRRVRFPSCFSPPLLPKYFITTSPWGKQVVRHRIGSGNPNCGAGFPRIFRVPRIPPGFRQLDWVLCAGNCGAVGQGVFLVVERTETTQ